MTKGRPIQTFPDISDDLNKAWHIKVIQINDNAQEEAYLATLDLNTLKLIFRQQSQKVKISHEEV